MSSRERVQLLVELDLEPDRAASARRRLRGVARQLHGELTVLHKADVRVLVDGQPAPTSPAPARARRRR